MDKRPNDMTIEELTSEFIRVKSNLCDLEDVHSFTFAKTAVHIGAEKAQNIQLEYEEERRLYYQRISEIEKALKERIAAQ